MSENELAEQSAVYAQRIMDLEKEVDRLKGHLPDVCINETCGEEDNPTTEDVVCLTVNTLPFLNKLTTEEFAELSDKIGNLHRQAMHVAVKETRQRNDLLIQKLELANKENKFLEHDNKNLADDNKFLHEAIDAAIKDTKYFEDLFNQSVDQLGNTVCAKCHLPWGDGDEHDKCWRVVEKGEEEIVRKITEVVLHARKFHDGHFYLFGFTTNFKGNYGTPDLDSGKGREEIKNLPSFNSIEDLLDHMIKEKK